MKNRNQKNETRIIASSAVAAFVLSFLIILIIDQCAGGVHFSMTLKLALAAVFALLLVFIDKIDPSDKEKVNFVIDKEGNVLISGTCAGTVIGDIAGSKYEFDNIKTKDFPLFSDGCRFTDDTVMACAVKSGLARWLSDGRRGDLHDCFIDEMKYYGNKYSDAGYGRRFTEWLESETREPYNSLGNGSAMRVSPCGFLASTIEEAREWAVISAEVTHNHPDGINGAEAVAAAIFTARNTDSKEDVRREMEKYYKIDFTLDEIRPSYTFDVTCEGSIPQAFECFLESKDFEDCIRNCISIGGDCDTTGAIAGAVAEAFFGIPEEINEEALSYLPDDLLDIIEEK